MDRYWASERHLFSARQLHNRFNALLGHARATTYMGGTPVIASDSPQPATVRGTVVQGGIPECWDSRSS
ncbi:hypothetical protein GCM10010449_84290 [Streptomyces rectiviolaceus]|uniref:Transposase n=2 Tax=Streptomyces rectiviolaceus TaxID=332591 RepID=A0ABP6NQB3_9ACTN